MPHSRGFPWQSSWAHHVALLSVLALLAAQTGCLVGPDHCLPATPVPDQWHQSLQDGTYVDAQGLCHWWMLFEDPILNHLIQYAGSHNLTLQAALARIWQARCQRCIVETNRLVQVNGRAAYQRTLQSLNAIGASAGIPAFLLGARSFWSTGFDATWEPDIFGRVYRQIESADATVCFNVEDYRDILVTLYGDIARGYVEVRSLQARLEYAHRNVEIQRQALELARKRVEGGVSPVVDQYQAESNLAFTEAEIPPLETQLHLTLNRLSVLVGEYPGSLHSLLCPVAPIPRAPEHLPLVVPCDIIRQRPDIRRAERLVAARTAEVGVATADLFPRLVINGSFGLQSQSLKDLFERDSYTYQFGPSFSWPILQWGRIKCNIERNRALVEEAVTSYEQTVLSAVEEVENAIVAYNKEVERQKALRRAVEATQKSLESVLELYRGGKTNFQNVLDTQRTLFINQNNLAASEGQVIVNLIALYKALGGGWQVHSHCERQIVRVACPERSDPSICEAGLKPATQAEPIPTPRAKEEATESPREEKEELPADETDRDELQRDLEQARRTQSSPPRRFFSLDRIRGRSSSEDPDTAPSPANAPRAESNLSPEAKKTAAPPPVGSAFQLPEIRVPTEFESLKYLRESLETQRRTTQTERPR